MRHQVENRVAQALSRSIARTIAESRGRDPRLDLSASKNVTEMLRHGANALASQGREALARRQHQHRISVHSADTEAAGPLMLLGAIEADLLDDSDGASYLAENTSVDLAVVSAASLLLHLAHDTQHPDIFFTQASASIRDLGRGTYQGRIAQDFIADILAAYKRRDHDLHCTIKARWRPTRDRIVVTAICQVVTVCLASYVSLNEPYATNETTDPMEDVHHLIAVLRADLLGLQRPGLDAA